MAFRDQKLTCRGCGQTFFFTVTEQRQMAAQVGADAIVPPELCPTCRNKRLPSREQAQVMAMPETAPTGSRSRPHKASAQGPARTRGKPKATEVQEPIRETQADLSGLEGFPLEVEGVKIKLIGRVKWYSREKGYGFVTTANNREIFFHRASLEDRNARLHEGDQVEFQIEQTAKGPEAINVSLLPED